MILFNEGLYASSLRSYDTLSQPRLLVTTLGQEEIATLEGDRFYSFYDVTLAADETKYIAFELPVDATVIVGLQKRTFQSFDEAVEMEILWDYTYNDTGLVPLDVFNENNFFRNPEGEGNETGNQYLVNVVPNTSIVSEGTIREVDFIPSTGVGSNTAGQVSPELGFRIYKPGTGFIFKVHNIDTNSPNRVLIAYSWIEAPITL